MRVKWRDDQGQLLLLIYVYMLVASVLVMVVIDASKLYLYKRSLAAAADGAALAAAQSLDRSTFYREGPGAELPLDAAAVDAAVAQYVDTNLLTERYDGFAVEPPTLSADGHTVTVRVHSSMRLPFSGFFTGGDREIDVAAEASAQAVSTG